MGALANSDQPFDILAGSESAFEAFTDLGSTRGGGLLLAELCSGFHQITDSYWEICMSSSYSLSERLKVTFLLISG